jgi:hypothetical protein
MRRPLMSLRNGGKGNQNLKEEKEKLYTEMVTALNDKDEEIRNLHNANKELLDYINCLENKLFKIRARMCPMLQKVKNS